MKKTIIYLGLAFVAFSNVTIAANAETIASGIEREYVHITPLGRAIATGDVATAKKIIEYGGSINEKSNGMTPLMIAARYNRTEIITMLLEKGADSRIKDDKGLTALRYAELSNAKEALELLKAVK